MTDSSEWEAKPTRSDNKELEELHTVTSVGPGCVEEIGNRKVPAPRKATLRTLRPRHVQLMAISGAIGTGLFVGSGIALARAGPAGLLMGYALYALLAWSTFNAVGEMVVWLPVDGSFLVFANVYLDEAWGFALGVLYTTNNALIVASEISAICSIIGFWTDQVDNAVWVAIITTSLVVFNIFGVRFFGEGEFYFSLFKVLLILGLIVMTFILMVGGNPQHDAFGFRYWNNPGAFNDYLVAGLTGRFLGFWSVFIQAAFAFGGPDYIALAAGETHAPRRVLPTVFTRVIYRLIFFYILGVLAVGILVPYDDPNLTLGKPGGGSSPFVIGVTRLRIPVLPHIINAVLLTSAWSCALELFFAATRSLYSMAVDGRVPRILLFSWRGVPTYCVIAIWLVSQLAYMASSNNSLTVFTWLTSIVGSGNLLVYTVFHITYIRFRRAQRAQSITDDQRPWYRQGQYYYSIASLFFYIIILLTSGFKVFIEGHWSTADFMFAYFSLVLFLVAYAGYKLVKRPKAMPLVDVPLMAGYTLSDIGGASVENSPRTRLEKFDRWLWG